MSKCIPELWNDDGDDDTAGPTSEMLAKLAGGLKLVNDVAKINITEICSSKDQSLKELHNNIKRKNPHYNPKKVAPGLSKRNNNLLKYKFIQIENSTRRNSTANSGHRKKIMKRSKGRHNSSNSTKGRRSRNRTKVLTKKQVLKLVWEKVEHGLSRLGDNLRKFLVSDFGKKLTEAYTCISRSIKHKSAQNAVNNIKTFMNKTQEIISPAKEDTNSLKRATLRLVIESACHHDAFIVGYKHLINGVNESEFPKKFSLFGRFKGGLIFALGDGDLQRKKRGRRNANKQIHSGKKKSHHGKRSQTNSNKSSDLKGKGNSSGGSKRNKPKGSSPGTTKGSGSSSGNTKSGSSSKGSGSSSGITSSSNGLKAKSVTNKIK